MRIVIINGPNLANIGKREPQWYGEDNFDIFYSQLKQTLATKEVELDYFQSHCEGAIVGHIHQCKQNGVDAIVLNAGAYTHTSIAIRDAISAVALPVVEVHLSNVYAREEFRHKSMLAGVCIGSITGFGLCSYQLAVEALINKITLY